MLKILFSVLPPIENAMGQRNISVIQITAGDKFFITKSPNISWMMEELKKSYAKYLDRSKGILETNMFFPLLKHLYSKEITTIQVDALFTDTNGYKVLKFELEQLSQHFGTKPCLNTNNIPYIPKTKLAKKGSNWLSQNEALNFRKLLKNYNY